MASIRERTNPSGKKTYHVQVRIKGQPPQTKTFESKTLARQWANIVETELRNGRWLPKVEAERHTVRETLEKYRDEYLAMQSKKRLRNDGQQLRWWIDRLGDYRLSDLTPALIGRCKTELFNRNDEEKRERAPATVVRYMAVLSHALTLATKEWQWLPESPMAKVEKPKVNNGKTRFLDPNELARLLQAARNSESKSLYLIVLLAVSTGMRRGEILSLKWKNIVFDADGEAGLIILENTKNKDQRGVPIVDEALREVSRLREAVTVNSNDTLDAEALLFPSPRKPLQPLEIRKAWDTAVKNAELSSPFRFHDLRHTAASFFAMSGATLRDIAEILGHRDLTMVKRYAHLSKQHLKSVAQQMSLRHLQKKAE